METTLSFFTSLIYTIFGYCIGIFIFDNEKRATGKVVLTFLIYWLFYYFIIFIMDSAYSLFCSCVMFIPLLRSLFKEKIMKIVTVTYISNIFILAFKLFFLLIVSYNSVDSICDFNNYNKLKFFINISSVIFALLFMYIFKYKIKKFLDYMSKFKYDWLVLIILFAISILLSIATRYSDLELSKDTFVDCIVIISLVTIFIYSIDRNNKLDSLNNCYNEVYEYSKLSEELNLDYRLRLHENKNQLLLIDSMINSNNVKLKKYINYLLEQNRKKIDNYHLSELTYIPFPGIKNFINYKLAELNNLGATIEVFVSEDIKNIDIQNLNEKDYNDMTIALGVILDNIIDSIKKQKEKLVSLNIYLEDGKFHFQCANSFDGDIDLDKIYKKGYSTKGANRGVGLTLVKEVIENSDIIDCKPLVIDNFFMQDIIVKVPKIIK